MKNIFLVLIYIMTINCKGEEKKASLTSLNTNLNSKISSIDFTVVDFSSIGKEVSESSRKELITAYKNALEKDFERPYMWDVFIPENIQLPKFYYYKNYTINNIKINSYYIKIKYEDAKYDAIIIIPSKSDEVSNNKSSLIVYENLEAEELYKRTTRVLSNNIIDVTLEKDKKSYNKFQYILSENNFIEYFSKIDEKIEKQWGNKEEIDAEKGINSIYEYQMKGDIKNHVKNGHWEERRYSFEFDKSVWYDGDYINGIRNGEWNISPIGPVEKINVYKNGDIIKSYSP